ncbi:MAG: hypothetical protein ACKOW2_00505 [Sphingobacteriaceae bacterium]
MLAEAELLELIAHKIRFIEQKPSVFGIHDIPFSGQIMNKVWVELIEKVGAIYLGPVSSVQAALPKLADTLIIQPSGLSISETLSSLPDLMAISGWNETHAVIQQKVFLVNDVLFQYLTTLEQIEILAEIIYPKLFAFGHEGSAWIKLNF